MQQRRSRKTFPFFLLLLILAILTTTVLLAAVVWERFYPNNEYVPPGFGAMDKPIFYQGQMLAESAIGEKENLKLPFSIIQEYVDPNIHYEESSRSVIITTADRVVRMQSDQLTAVVNEKPFDLRFPVEILENGSIYLPIAALSEFYGIQLQEVDTGAVFLAKAGDITQIGRTVNIPGKPQETIALRSEPTIKAPILVDLPQDEEVMIWVEEQGWYRIQLMNGYTGYVAKKWIQLNRVEIQPEIRSSVAHVPWKPLGDKINLTWEMVTTRNPDTSKIGPMPGLNVISPTWFELQDGEGNIKNLASSSYVKWAHDQGYQIWALFSNKTEPDWTSSALSTYDKRIKMIKQLISYAQMYQIQGINVDFEYMYLKDKENLTQFMREMVPLLHEQGLVVSIDVTPKSSSQMWSMFYDRTAIGEVVDYMIIMGYDQHGGGSQVAGSVGTIPWVDTAIRRIIEEDHVPPHKLILAVPFYTRIWTEDVVDGKTKVSSRAVFMNSTDKIIQDLNLKVTYQTETGQNYVEYRENGKLNKIWLEDDTSMTARLDLIKKYGLAGVASWRRGYESPAVWDLIKDVLERKP